MPLALMPMCDISDHNSPKTMSTIDTVLDMFLGAAVAFSCTMALTPSPTESYNAGAMDALSGKIQPIIHIEDGDTTITYKPQ